MTIPFEILPMIKESKQITSETSNPQFKYEAISQNTY